MRQRPPHRSRPSAFSLIELLLVLVILSVLAAIVVPKFTGLSEKSRITKAQTEIANIGTALQRFEIEIGRFPRTEEGLHALTEAPAGLPEGKWTGPYIDIRKDPWGNAYTYESPGRHNTKGYDLSSAGPDVQEGTADDITNWSTDDERR